MKKTGLITFLLLTAFFNGKGQTKIDISSAAELDVTDKLNVEYIISDANYVEITGALNDKVDVVQSENKIRIKMVSGYPLKGNEVEVKLYTQGINKFLIQKGAIVSASKVIDVDSLFVVANEGGKLDVAVNAQHVDVSTTTGSTVELRGNTKTQNIISTFGGGYKGESLKSETAYVRTNGGGVCEVQATITADVQTRAGGVINVFGSPSEKKQKRIAGGKITFVD